MNLSPLARIGRSSRQHRTAVIVVWAIFALGLGVVAPRLESALSGAMWEVSGSHSQKAWWLPRLVDRMLPDVRFAHWSPTQMEGS